jgi:hypothetical protein
VSAEGVSVAVASDEGAGDSGHLVAELEVVFCGADAIPVGEGEIEDANEESGDEDGARGGKGRSENSFGSRSRQS